MSIRWKVTALLAAGATAATVIALISTRPRTISLRGAVLLNNVDPRKQSPIAGVSVSVADDLASADATTDFSGLFSVRLLPWVVPKQDVTLRFRHPDYQPLDLTVSAGDELYLARMLPAYAVEPPAPGRPVVLSHLVVRYTVESHTATNIGAGAKAFEVPNMGNLPCNGHPPCSPDGKWKAAIGGVSLDAGADNEFRNARLSCIAGPCPFTRVETNNYSKGGRTIGATVRNWSDTTTFLLEAEVFRPQISDTIQRLYPILFGEGLNFTLPASAEGASIQAELDGQEVIFPLPPDAALSWAGCEVLTNRDQTRVYRCELKPGYVFKEQGGE
jgi:hypothetical protein